MWKAAVLVLASVSLAQRNNRGNAEKKRAIRENIQEIREKRQIRDEQRAERLTRKLTKDRKPEENDTSAVVTHATGVVPPEATEFMPEIPVFMINEYQWQSGYPEGIENGTAMDRSSWQVRSMLHTIVCQNDPNCAFEKTDFFRALNNYGCNCFSKSATSPLDPSMTWIHMSHVGPAVNEIDQACIDVHNAYLCMFMDSEEGILKQGRTTASDGSKIEGCYEGMPFTYHVGSDGNIVCGPANNPEYAKNKWNGCRQAACEIERHFAYTVVNQLADPLAFKSEANADNLYFWNPIRKSNMCRGDGLGMKRNRDQCCGDFPTRYPFASDTFECCGSSGENKGFGEC
jgi:hypothetical protein